MNLISTLLDVTMEIESSKLGFSFCYLRQPTAHVFIILFYTNFWPLRELRLYLYIQCRHQLLETGSHWHLYPQLYPSETGSRLNPLTGCWCSALWAFLMSVHIGDISVNTPPKDLSALLTVVKVKKHQYRKTI